MRTKTSSLLSLFSGVGGLDGPFLKRGARLVGAHDLNADANATYALAYGHAPSRKDVASLSPSDFPTVDIVLASPPCQGFTSIGARNPLDARNGLIVKTAALIAAIRPRLFVIENVPGLKWLDGGSYLRAAQDKLKAAGLTTGVVSIECWRFGVAQHRRRVLIVGGAGLAGERFLAAVERSSSRNSKGRTVGEVLLPASALRGLPNHDLGRRDWPAWYSEVIRSIRSGGKLCDTRQGKRIVHSWDVPKVFGSVTSEQRQVLEAMIRVRRQKHVDLKGPLGDGRPCSPARLAKELERPTDWIIRQLALLEKKGFVQSADAMFDLKRRFNGRFKRLPLEGLSPAVTADFAYPRAVLHPTLARPLTVRECARLQGFGDAFEFVGSRSAQYQLVANAFPPPVAARLARLAEEALA